jgi:hypothetical protein
VTVSTFVLFFSWLVYVTLYVEAQTPTQQMAMRLPVNKRPWVVSKVMIARMQLEPVTEKGYATFPVKGEDGYSYSIDDVLAGVLEVLEKERR